MGKVMLLCVVYAVLMRVFEVAYAEEAATVQRVNVPRTTLAQFSPYKNGTKKRRMSFDGLGGRSPKGSIKSFSSVVPVRPSRKSSASRASHAEMTLYVDFLIDYTSFVGWSTAFLIFPNNTRALTEESGVQAENEMCDFVRTISLRAAGPDLTCVSHYPGQQPSFQDFGGGSPPQPIIVFNSQAEPNGRSAPVPVHPNFLVDYRSSRPILVVGGKDVDRELIVHQLQPEINANYKWTLASTNPSSTDSNFTSITIHDIFGFATSSTPIANRIGSWSRSTGITIDLQKSLGPQDFMGNLIRVTSLNGPPVVYVTKTPKGYQGSGYLFDMLDAISTELNFTIDVLPPADNSFGAIDATGNWTGMVGLLQKKEAGMAIMSFSLTAQRRTVMDFSPPVEYSATRLLIRRDWKNSELKWNAFLRPFEWKVWMAIPILVSIGVFTFVVFRHFQIIETTPGNSAWILSSCFLLQGHSEQSSVLPYRIALGTFWILALVIYASYTARLTSFLAATPDTMPIHSLAEAVSNKNWKMGVAKGSAVLDRVKESTVGEMKQFWQRLQHDPTGFVSGFQEGIQKVFQERYIFFTSDLIPSFLVKGNCSYAWLPGNYFPGFGYMGYQKNFPFASVISQRVSQLRETGQMKRLFRKWWGAESTCSSASGGDGFLGMSLYETGTAFLILIVGAILALTFIIAEICFRKTINQNPSDSLQFEEGGHSKFSDHSIFPGTDYSTSQFPYTNSNTTYSKADLETSIHNTWNKGEYGTLYK